MERVPESEGRVVEVSEHREPLAEAEGLETPRPPEVVPEDVSSPKLKRRRISGKRPSPPEHRSPPAVSESEKVEAAEVRDAAEVVNQEDALDIRKRLLSKYGYWWRRKHKFSLLRGVARKTLAAKYNLRTRDIAMRDRRLHEYLVDHPSDGEAVQRVKEEGQELDTGERIAVREAFFLTWNGDWGMLGVEDNVDAARVMRPAVPSDVPPTLSQGASPGPPAQAGAVRTRLLDVPNACCPSSRVDPEYEHKQVRRIVATLQTHPETLRIRAELERFLERLGNLCPGLRCAWAVEVCPRALAQHCRVRLHAHAFCKLTRKAKLPRRVLEFMGSTPHFSDALACPSFGRSRNLAAGLYYLQAPKVCSVFSGGSQMPHEDYGVTARMVLTMVQSNKMAYNVARSELSKIPCGIVNNLQCLERWYRERCDAKLEELTRWHRSLLTAEQRPWRDLPLVEVWLQQYRTPQPRFKFLVLDGPSRMGKTLFARSLCADGDVLELNMAGGAAADLRAYDILKHELLLFDECTPAQVLQNKKLFQAGAAMIQMGTSSTNVYAFQIYVAGKKFVVSSNVWCQELPRCSWADAQWLQENSVLVKVDRPLWQEHPQELLPMASG